MASGALAGGDAAEQPLAALHAELHRPCVELGLALLRAQALLTLTPILTHSP